MFGGARQTGHAGEVAHSRVTLIGGEISVDKPRDKTMVKAWSLPSDLLDSSIVFCSSVSVHEAAEVGCRHYLFCGRTAFPAITCIKSSDLLLVWQYSLEREEGTV